MKALTLTQPWATLVAIGAKRIETRSWKTDYRGPLAIHAAKGWTKADRELLESNPFYVPLAEHYAGLSGHGSLASLLPRGEVVAIVFLDDVRRIDMAFRAYVLSQGQPNEIEYGDYTTGRYAWMLTGISLLPLGVPAKGALGLWEWEQ